MQRHRNPANGYRSNPIGIGGGGGGGGGYRSYNRGGFGRGQAVAPPRRMDVFMEAGKLATEYLVSKGLLNPNSVSGNGRWQNSNFKGQFDGVSDAVSGTGSGRRRFGDEVRARRSVVKTPAVESNREGTRERVKDSSDKPGDGESFSGSVEEQKTGKDVKEGAGENQKSVTGDLESKSYDAGKSVATDTTTTDEQKLQNQPPDETEGVKSSVLEEGNTSSDDVDRESEKPVVKEDPPEEDNNNNNNKNDKSPNDKTSDLLALIRFNKIPTRTRSSVTLRGSKSDPVLISGDENKSKQDGENKGLEREPEGPEVETEQVQSEDDRKYEFGQGLHMRSLSFPQRSSVSDQQLSDEQGQGHGYHGYARSSSALLGEKRPLEIDDGTEAAKKPREWVPVDTQGDDYLHVGSARDGSSSQEGTTLGITQPCNPYAEEKQLFPSSFKICDLNLMEVGQVKQEPVSVDFDLTMNSSCDITDRHGKGVEVIDLDCDSMQEDDDNENDNENDNNNSERREEAIFTGLESFPDSMQRVSDMPQDGYGLMISELLDADIPNTSVSTGVNSMHNEMSLPNEEGMLGDDDSIYMSLGEIPISFVPVWDQQPSQGYDKRY